MEELPSRNWSADQNKALDEAEALLVEAFAQARDKLLKAGVDDEVAFSSCLRCSCEFFVPRSPDIIPGGEAPFLGCMRLGCRHLFTSHRVF